MTIVTKNSLTISNINDGTITHIAYANSADGTDGFYISGGRNLLNNTDKDISVTSHTTDGYPAWVNIDTGFSFEHGKTYTFSAEAKNSTDKIAEASIRVFENSTNTQVGIYAFPADGKRHSITFTIPNDSHNYHLLLYAGHAGIASGVDVTTTYHHQKLEEGDVSTPWSPAPSEAHPSYIGQYTDFNTTASTDPTKYRWSLIKGSDSYIHTAYSWSADGKDGFTTVYPNLNLLVNTSAKTKDGFFKNFDKVENDYGEVTIKGTNTWVNKNLWDGFSIQPRDYKPNDKYTMSMDVMFTSWNLPAGTTLTEFWIGQRYSSGGGISSYKQICAIDLPRDPSNMLNQWIRITKTSTIPPYENPAVNTEALFMTKFTGASEGSFTVRVRKPKQEKGSTATPWMPSASEVTTSDYPSYIGTYSDDNVESSSDYSKYQWAIFKGQNSNAYIAYSWSSDGSNRFTTVYPNLNLSDNTNLNYDNLPTGISNGGGTDKSEKIAITDLSGFSWGRKYTPSTRVAQTGMRVVTDVSKLKIGDTITNSFWVKNIGNRPIRFIPQLGFRYGTETEPNEGVATGWKYVGGSDTEVKNDGNWTKLTFTTTIPQPTIASDRTGDVLKSVVHYAYSSGAMMPLAVTDTFIISPLKLELGLTATPWMPSESEAQDQWQDAIPMYVGVGDKDSQNPTDYRWQLNPRYVQASSDSGLSNKAGVDDLASVADTANDALVQAQNAVSNEDYTSWLEHDYQTTINNLQDVSAQNQEDINNVDDRTTIVEGFYGEMKVKWNFIDESFTFSEEGMFISNAQSKMAIQVTSDKIVFWDNDVDVAFITGEVLNIQKGVFLESATIGNHLITKFSDDSPVTIIRYVGGIT